MKPVYSACALLLTILLFFVCCTKDQLSSATQEGRNTASFTINGEVVLPNAKCGAWIGECRAIRADTFTNPYYSSYSQFEFSIVRETKKSYINLSITVTFPKTAGNKIDSVSADLNCRNVGGAEGFYYGPVFPRTNSRFIITRIDTVNEIISGEFELVLFNQETRNTVVIKDGQFDLHFNTCVCSK